jgi:hypothetical protein
MTPTTCRERAATHVERRALDPAQQQDNGCGESRRAEAGMQHVEKAEQARQHKQHDADANGTGPEHHEQQHGRQRSCGRADGAVERCLPRCTEIRLRDDQRREHGPISLRQMPPGVHGVGDGSREPGFDSLLQGGGFAGPEAMACWNWKFAAVEAKDLQRPCGGLYSGCRRRLVSTRSNHRRRRCRRHRKQRPAPA